MRPVIGSLSVTVWRGAERGSVRAGDPGDGVANDADEGWALRGGGRSRVGERREGAAGG